MKRSDDKWKKVLSKEQFEVLRKKATEAPFSGNFLYNEDNGTYICGACHAQLFDSNAKFNGNCGWPSFNNVINNKAVTLKEDRSHGMQRVEVLCSSCGSHLGHVFHDAPNQPTGMRFCINSIALDFIPKNKKSK